MLTKSRGLGAKRRQGLNNTLLGRYQCGLCHFCGVTDLLLA